MMIMMMMMTMMMMMIIIIIIIIIITTFLFVFLHNMHGKITQVLWIIKKEKTCQSQKT